MIDDTEYNNENYIIPDGDELKRTNLQVYLNDIRKYPLLTQEEEIELAKIIKNGSKEEQAKAKKELIECNLKLVVNIAKRYYKFVTPSYTLLDIIQEGNFGLMKAVDSFDETRGFKFSTYATLLIQQYIKFGAVTKSKTIRNPNTIYVKLKRIAIIQNQLTYKLERIPKEEEIIDEYNKQYCDENMTLKKYEKIMDAIKPLTSLDLTIGESNDTTMNDFLIDKNINVEEEVVNKEFVKYIFDIMNKHLTQRERNIILRRYGFIKGREENLDEIASDYHLTFQRISQIEEDTLNKIRKKVKK